MSNVSLSDGGSASTSAALHCSNPSLVQQGPNVRAASTPSRFNWGLLAALVGNVIFWVGLFLLL